MLVVQGGQAAFGGGGLHALPDGQTQQGGLPVIQGPADGDDQDADGQEQAVMLGSTETTFYTIAVYFGATGIRKSRYAVPAALCADAAGFFFAALTVRLFMK